MPPAVQNLNRSDGLSPSNKKLRASLAETVTLIQFADLWNGQGTIAQSDSVRVDVQSKWSQGGWNIQAQYGKKSFAAILLSDTLEQAAGALQQQAVVQAVQQALTNSAQNESWYSVT